MRKRYPRTGGDVDEAEHRRGELAGFLKARRRTLEPRAVGLPQGGRRRSPGLRREEVAVLAGLSPTWYSYLEQGRSINPSVGVLESLCRVLALSADERRYLFEMAHAQVPAERGEADPDDHGAQALQALVGSLEQWDHPVYATDCSGDLVAWNGAVAGWLADFSAAPRRERNLVRWVFTAPEARRRLVHWELEARHLVATLRTLHSTRTGRSGGQGLVDEMLRESADFTRWWRHHEIGVHRTRERVLRHRNGRERRFLMNVLHPADDASMTFVFHHPLDDAARSASSDDGTHDHTLR